MLDPIVNFFTRIFQWIGRGIGLVIGVILWPFMWAGRWYTQRGWILKAVLGIARDRSDRPLRQFHLEARRYWNEFQSGLCRQMLYIRDRNGLGCRRASRRRRRGRRRKPRHCYQARHRRRHGRSDRFQRQSERLDLVDDPLQARLLRHGLGPYAVPRQQGGFPARHQPGGAPHRGRTGRHARPRARHQSQIDQQPAGCARRSRSSTRKRWYFGLSPFGPKTPTPELLPRRRSRDCAHSTTAC